MSTKIRDSLSRFSWTENAWALPFLALVVLAWLALYLMALDHNAHELHRPHHFLMSWADYGIALLMWWGMSIAMMLPTIMPAIHTLRDICFAADQKGEDVGRAGYFVFGFLAVWFAFGVLAAGLQVGMHNLSLLAADTQTTQLWLSALLFVGAGVYQFTPLKEACVSKCRAPMTFFMTYWEEGNAGFISMGKRQGIYCLGCCWAMMLLMFAFGVMNLVWMFILTLYMFAEKNWIAHKAFDKVTGAVLIAVGFGMMALSLGMSA